MQLIDQSANLEVGDENGQCVDVKQQQQCRAWIAAAQNAVHLLCMSEKAPYRQHVDDIASKQLGYVIHRGVGRLAAILKNLIADADAGLLASVADQARAETFDNFLDHAESYARDSRKNEAGVIAGVVFEDALRRVCRKFDIDEKDKQLDQLISALAARGELSGVKAKRARASADVRTKATHAQWDEFEMNDVRATIEFTREFIEDRLET